MGFHHVALATRDLPATHRFYTDTMGFEVADVERCKANWLAAGYDVMEVDHGWCVSVYAVDPNGILVEWCTDTRPLGREDREEAERLLADPHPPLEAGGHAVFHKAPVR